MKEHNIYITILITMIIALMGILSYYVANPTRIYVPLPPPPPISDNVPDAKYEYPMYYWTDNMTKEDGHYKRKDAYR